MRLEDAKIRVPEKKTEVILEKNNNNRRRVSVYAESYKGEYYNILVDKLIPFKNQTRKLQTISNRATNSNNKQKPENANTQRNDKTQKHKKPRKA